MSKLPKPKKRHRICVICEGYEELECFKRLMELNVWSDSYEFYPINAKSASNIPSIFQDVYKSDRYEIVLVFCDTDKSPYKEYSIIKKKINGTLNKRKVAEKVIIFANPCTMQIILSHFGDVSLKTQSKKTNENEIERLTGIKNYRAHEDQIKAISQKINRRNYKDMKARVAKILHTDDTLCSTNMSIFLEYFENSDGHWMKEINSYMDK